VQRFLQRPRLARRRHVGKRVLRNEPASDRGAEELLRPLHGAAGSPVGVLFSEGQQESVGIARGDVIEGLARAEEIE
jgi:hypothetical protein